MPDSNPSAMVAESLSDFSKSVYKAFSEVESQARQEVARSLSDNRELKLERDKALKDLHAVHLESQSWKQELASANAALSQAELTISHQSDTIASQAETVAQLRRELTHWKNQSRNWQEHFLRVEQERCAQSSRIDELVVEKLQLGRPTPNANALSSSSTTKRAFNSNSSPTQPPAYKTAAPGSPEEPSQFTHTPTTQANTSARSSAKRPKSGTKAIPLDPADSGSDAIVSSPQKRSRKNNANIDNRTRLPKNDPPALPRSTTVIRRVQAVIHVKQESDSEEESPSKYAAAPEEMSVSRSRSKRNRRIVDDDDEVDGSENSQEPDISQRLRNRSHINYQEDEEEDEEEDDELMLMGGDDYNEEFSPPRKDIQHPKRPPATAPAKKKRKQARR